MSIEEKAKDFACYNSFPDGSTKKEMDNRYDGFKAGAEWMIVRATAWLVKQGLGTNDGVVTICVRDFIKDMEK